MRTNSTHLLFLLALFFISCSNDDTATQVSPQTIVEIQITNEHGSDVQGVEVSLYKNQLDWATEQNPVQTVTTASNGIGRFMYLTDSAYYINAVSGELSNWENSFRISGIEYGKSHFAKIRLDRHKSRMISEAKGKSWRVHAYKINGNDVTNDTSYACITDNTWIFFKGNRSGRFERHENSLSCSPGSPGVESGSWQITPNDEFINLPQNGAVLTYKLLHISPDVLRLERTAFSVTTEITLVKL